MPEVTYIYYPKTDSLMHGGTGTIVAPEGAEIINADVTFHRGDKLTVNAVIKGSLSALELQAILDRQAQEP